MPEIVPLDETTYLGYKEKILFLATIIGENKGRAMQITVDKKTGSLLIIIVLLLAIIFGISVSRDSDDEIGMHHDATMGMLNDRSTAYTGADIMFLQMMIPHHQQAIDISNLALKTSKDSELLALAKIIIKAQSAEIIQMESWLKDANSNSGMGHSMHDMGGMLDDSQISALSAASGKTFDSLWLKGMIGHHDGAIHMATMIRDASNPEIKAFGENIVKDQSAQITQMKEMLKRIG